MLTKSRLKRFTVKEYHQLSELGFLPPNQRTELVDGQIYFMVAKNSPHSVVTKSTYDYLLALFKGKAKVRCQEPIILGDRSEPEPDIVIVKKKAYRQGHPTVTDVFLVIEISDSTLDFDLNEKAEMYARAGIPEYWVVDVKTENVHLHQLFPPGSYRRVGVITPTQGKSLGYVQGVEIDVSQFFLEEE